jgi:hypothetical protein
VERPGPPTGSDHDLDQRGKESSILQVFASTLRRLRRLIRPPVKQGHIRLEWTCVSEQPLFLRA